MSSALSVCSLLFSKAVQLFRNLRESQSWGRAVVGHQRENQRTFSPSIMLRAAVKLHVDALSIYQWSLLSFSVFLPFLSSNLILLVLLYHATFLYCDQTVKAFFFFPSFVSPQDVTLVLITTDCLRSSWYYVPSLISTQTVQCNFSQAWWTAQVNMLPSSVSIK